MPDITTDKTAPVTDAPVVAAVTPTPPTTPPVPTVPLSSTVTTEGEPNGLPPAAPEVQLQPPSEVIALREFKHRHIDNSVHSRDTPHYNGIVAHLEAVIAMVHSKYPLAKDDLNPVTKDA
jgi:hypothetical protein